MKPTHYLTSAALGLATLVPAAGAQDDTAELRDKYAEKQKKEFVGKVPWARTFDEARATAKKQGKLVLGYFTRSYAP